jgi:hypothetical protein
MDFSCYFQYLVTLQQWKFKIDHNSSIKNRNYIPKTKGIFKVLYRGRNRSRYIFTDTDSTVLVCACVQIKRIKNLNICGAQTFQNLALCPKLVSVK